MATKKAGGSSRNGRDSAGRRLGVKKYGGETVQAVEGSQGTLLFHFRKKLKLNPVKTLGKIAPVNKDFLFTF